jgi:hypothetical protein
MVSRTPHFALHLEVRRGAALDQVDESEVPEVKGQLHKREPILATAASLPDLDRAQSVSNPFLYFRQLDMQRALGSKGPITPMERGKQEIIG